ncbi:MULTISPECIES: bifunctional sugar phosphate isomerase/epimerase/4-hydroxyphenylpyruvate dioxygenase family protein [Nocardioides]|uniref:3-dehydroshikimate dehydratase n=1 Tax=Nocardioides vastitatis TaxID=2568655 RepID=A0ABW0ZGK3_9ACTN|nr:sugar phosphate isomerase/epimerase and 4-hydroxyphenylpyruvate domain-containing protein [Nocardioides sp.]THJ04327.1 sugar phosphate isomerase/epimerase and 4-hydroxyphenylpyruvate domain-containing protein [Nocardioides sp.]
MRRSIATVCLSGSLAGKMDAAAAAGFDGLEIFEPDLVSSETSPEEIRARADRLGLSLDLYQPFRDFEGVREAELLDNLRRAEARFAVMRRLGIDTVLVCSNVGTATVDSDEVSAAQLRRLGDLADGFGIRVAFEALAWGRYIDDYRRAWRVVERADHPAVGVCLDSFHILSRGHDPAAIEDIPGEKIFFVQLADAPYLSMDVLSWSRHHRLFPGEGDFDLPDFVRRVMSAGYRGPLSLEVFNDTFRQTDTARTATHALRSLVWLEDQASKSLTGTGLQQLPALEPPSDLDFVEIKAENTDAVEEVLGQLGLTFLGQHRTKPVRLWASGQARVVLNEQHARDLEPHVAAIGVQVSEPYDVEARARALAVAGVVRRAAAGEQRLAGFSAPGGLEVFLGENSYGDEPAWVQEFQHGQPPALRAGRQSDANVTGVDHVNLVHTWDDQDEAVLFYTSVLGLTATPATEVASPHGLVRSRVMRTAAGRIRLPLNVAPAVSTAYPEHVAFSCGDIFGVAAGARVRGMRFLPVPNNYYDDLVARFHLDQATVDRLREYQLLYDRDEHGTFLHFYTRRIGRMFFEIVQRSDDYDGYGAANAHVRLAAQARLEP